MLSIEDERAVTAVLLRYCTALDTQDWPLFLTCFAPGLTVDYGAFGTWDDAEGFCASMQAFHEGQDPALHRLTNVVVAATAGGASARSYVHAVMAGKPDEPLRQGLGVYDDDLVRTADGWRIQARRYTALSLPS